MLSASDSAMRPPEASTRLHVHTQKASSHEKEHQRGLAMYGMHIARHMHGRDTYFQMRSHLHGGGRLHRLRSKVCAQL